MSTLDLRVREGEESPNSARTAVVLHKGWGEFRTQEAAAERDCGILSIEVFDLDVRLSDRLVVGVSGYFGKDWFAAAAGISLPTARKSRHVYLDADVHLEVGVAISVDPLFEVRCVDKRGVYGGPNSPDEVSRWTYTSAGFWIGCDVESRLNALYLPV